MIIAHIFFFFFFNDTATTEIYTLSLHDALPIFPIFPFQWRRGWDSNPRSSYPDSGFRDRPIRPLSHLSHPIFSQIPHRSEEHTSELQSRPHLVCRLLLEKKKKHCPPGDESHIRH